MVWKELYWALFRVWNRYFCDPLRFFRHLCQKLIRGHSDRECYNLDATVARYIIPRLKTFKRLASGYPPEFRSMKEWHAAIDEMIWSFEFVLSDYNCEEYDFKNPKKWEMVQALNMKRYQKGIEMFAKYYNGLWD